MNKEIAIDIDCFATEDVRDLFVLSEKLGFETGVFAAQLPSDWIARVKSILPSDQPARATLVELIKMAKKQWLLPYPHIEGSLTFIEAIRQAEKEVDFACVISPTSGQGFASLPEVIAGKSSRLLKPAHSATIETSIAAYLKAFRPLILKSSELHLIDPYSYNFSTALAKGDWKEFFEGVKVIGNQAPKSLRTFYIHCWPGKKQFPSDEWLTNSLTDLNNHLAKLPGSPLKVKFLIRNDAVKHDRYFLSVKGGLSIGWGVVFGPHEGETTVSYLCEDDHYNLHKKFVSETDLSKSL